MAIFPVLGFVIGILIVLFVFSALLRIAVATANKIIGPVKPPLSTIGWDWDADEDEDDEDDDLEAARRGKPSLPEPGIAQGMVIMFLVLVVNLVIRFILALVLDFDHPFRGDWDEQIVPILLGVAIGFLSLMGLLAAMLPCRTGPAALATLFLHIYFALLIALIAGLLYLIARGV